MAQEEEVSTWNRGNKYLGNYFGIRENLLLADLEDLKFSSNSFKEHQLAQ